MHFFLQVSIRKCNKLLINFLIKLVLKLPLQAATHLVMDLR